jgi:DNA-binding transcriptional regulator YiaG
MSHIEYLLKKWRRQVVEGLRSDGRIGDAIILIRNETRGKIDDLNLYRIYYDLLQKHQQIPELLHHAVNPALQNLNHSKSNLLNRSYGLKIPLPKYFFNKDYPIDPKTFGERLRRARMDAGLLFKEFTALIGVTEDTVINWEVRGMKPWRRDIRNKVNQLVEN